MEKSSIRYNYLAFIRKPDYNGFRDISEKEKMVIVFKVFLLSTLGLIIVNIPMVILKEMGVISPVGMKSEMFIRSIPANHSNLETYLLCWTIFLVPVFEESTFRLCLGRFKVKYLIASVSLLTGIFIVLVAQRQFWMPKSYFLMPVVSIGYILLFALIAAGFMWHFREKIRKAKHIWNQNTGISVYFISILFAAYHINNLKFEPGDWFFMPLILAPFFVYGMSLSYLRIRLGIGYSILLHFFINLLASVRLLQQLHQ